MRLIGKNAFPRRHVLKGQVEHKLILEKGKHEMKKAFHTA